jgi:nitroreductase
MVLVMLLLAGVGVIIGLWPAFLVAVPIGLAAILAVKLVFDIVTVRFGIRPVEAVPRALDHLDAFDLMRARVSCRSFQSRDLTQNHLAELMEVVQINAAPDHQLGQRPIRFEYIAAPLKVWPTVGGHEFLVAIAPRDYDRLSVIDVGRSLQKIVLHATHMGLATCWIGPGADQKSVIEHLGDRFDPALDHVICVCALGYRSRFRPLALLGIQKSQRKRRPLSDLFFADPSFTEPLPTSEKPFDGFGRCYEVCQWSPSSYNAQPTRCAAVTERVNGSDKLVRFDFFSATASRYYAAVALGIWCANWETGCEALGQRGHFAVLSDSTRAVGNAPALPRYDVSWMIDRD